jgi:peptide deformylase
VRADETGIDNLAEGLWQLMMQHDGVGLAAPQVGDLRRVIVVQATPATTKPRRLVLINPVLTALADPKVTMEEGCLSFPGLYLRLRRPAAIQVRYRDLTGQTVEMETAGLLARVILHEMDHLDGTLFIDHLSWVKRWLLSWRLRRLAVRGRRRVVA